MPKTKYRVFKQVTEKDFGATMIAADNSFVRNMKTGEHDPVVFGQQCRIVSFPFTAIVQPTTAKKHPMERQFVLVDMGGEIYMVLNLFKKFETK